MIEALCAAALVFGVTVTTRRLRQDPRNLNASMLPVQVSGDFVLSTIVVGLLGALILFGINTWGR